MALTERRCALCNKDIEEGTAPVVCVRCHSLYHQECWQKIDRCVVYGCSEPKDSYGLVGSSDSEVPCPKCQEKNPRAAQKCLSCGEAIGTPLERQIFVSFAGWRASNDEDIIMGLSQHWDSAIRHLYGGDLEHWFGEHGRADWAKKAAEVRKEFKQRSIGLETFLQSTGLVEKPVLEVTPPRLILESSANIIETIIDITNSGRGYLFGKIKPSVPWISCSELEFSGNRNRIELTIEMENMPSAVETGALEISTMGQTTRVEVKATRIGVENALKAYHAGEFSKARALCRRLADSQAVSADVAIVLAACYLKEDNKGGAASVLGKLSGLCVHVKNDIIALVYEWYRQEAQFMGGLDQFAILEAMMATAEGEIKDSIKSDLAKLALERVTDLGSSVGTGSNLWQDKGDVKHAVNELLSMAVELDPKVAADAAEIRKQYSSNVRKSGANKFMWYVILLALIGGAGGTTWWVSHNQEERDYRPIKAALDAKDYTTAVREARILCDNHPDELDFFKYYLKVLDARIKSEIENNNLTAVAFSVNQMRGIVADHFALSTMASEIICTVAKDIETMGSPTEARIYYETALQLNGDNSEAAASRERLKDSTATFWKVYEISEGDLGQHICEDCANSPSLKDSISTLKSLGVTCYDGQMQLILRDINGDGARELVICGNDSKGTGHYDVYSIGVQKLAQVFSGESELPYLLYAQPYMLTEKGGESVAMAWGKNKAGLEKEVVILGYAGRKFITETAMGQGNVEFADHDGDKRIEIWVALAADGSEYKEGLCVYTPMFWTAPGFTKATGNYNEYYKKCIDGWQRELENNPHPKDSDKHKIYAKERNDAIVYIRAQMRQLPE